MKCSDCFYGVVYTKRGSTHFEEIKSFCTLIGEYVEEVIDCSAFITPEEMEDVDDE